MGVEWKKNLMKNKDYILLLLLIGLLVWWTRYDVYCNTPSACVAYDRLSSSWIKPLAVATQKSQMDYINNAKKLYNQNGFNSEKALIEGYTPNEIVDYLKLNNQKGKK